MSNTANGSEDILITFAIPCYNVAGYIDHCVQTILDGCAAAPERIEVILVDDGSNKDATPEVVDGWQAKLPQTVRAIHQDNGGHGMAVNTGLANAKGRYFKVVDADDWLDTEACAALLADMLALEQAETMPDLFIANYVYEKVFEGKRTPIRYANVMPERRIFTWDELGKTGPHQNILMHSVIYRTELLRGMGFQLPAHTFYVDNIFVYVPLPQVQSIYYLNADLYRYFIGREGQSVNEKVMASRIDQQLRITRIMIDAYVLGRDVKSARLRAYMHNYLSMMMTICSVFLLLSGREDAEEQRQQIWEYLRQHDPDSYKSIRSSLMGRGVNLPGALGRRMTIAGYRLARAIFKFN